jgi:hypothetical protein
MRAARRIPQVLLALDSKGCPLRLSNPTAEKARTGRGKHGSIIARDLVKGDRGQVKQTAWFCAAQQGNYRKSGFKLAYRNIRHQGEGGDDAVQATLRP